MRRNAETGAEVVAVQKVRSARARRQFGQDLLVRPIPFAQVLPLHPVGFEIGKWTVPPIFSVGAAPKAEGEPNASIGRSGL